MLLFGGRPAGGGGRPCNSLALFDPDTGAWEAPSAEGWRPSPRESHSACCTSSAQMVVVGGWDGTRWLMDMFLLDVPTMTWQHIEGAGPSPPPAVSEHVAVFWDYRIVVGGGTGAQGASGAVHTFDLVTQTWAREECSLELPNAIPRLAAAGASATPLAQGIVVVGGCSGETWDPHERRRYSRAAVLLEPGPRMRASPVAAPGGGFTQRAYHVAIPVTSGSLLVIGGRNADGVLGDQWLLTCRSSGEEPGTGAAGDSASASARADEEGDALVHHSLLPDGPMREEALKREELQARKAHAGCKALHERATVKRSQLRERREQLERNRPFLESTLEEFREELTLLRARSEFLKGNSRMHREELEQLRLADFRGSKRLEEMREERLVREAAAVRLSSAADTASAAAPSPKKATFLDSLIHVAEGEML